MGDFSLEDIAHSIAAEFNGQKTPLLKKIIGDSPSSLDQEQDLGNKPDSDNIEEILKTNFSHARLNDPLIG